MSDKIPSLSILPEPNHDGLAVADLTALSASERDGWWNTEGDARQMGRWLALLGARAGKGSTLHRKATEVFCGCARTLAPRAGEWRERVESELSVIEAWCKGEQADVVQVYQRLRGFPEDPPPPASESTYAYAAAHATLHAALYAMDVRIPAEAALSYSFCFSILSDVEGDEVKADKLARLAK